MSIETSETNDTLTVVFSGVEFRNLRRMADALNAMGWADHDNSAGSIFTEFCIMPEYLSKAEDAREEWAKVVDALEVNARGAEEQRRKEELMAACPEFETA